MSITLGGITLNPSLQWLDRYNYSDVAQTNLRTLGGTFVSFVMSTSGGRPVTLEATENVGWFTKTMVDAIKAMANIAGAVYVLDFYGETMDVMFNHEDYPAVEFTKLVPREPPQSTDPFSGTVKLITV